MEPLVFLDSLKEAHLFFLEGMTNGNEIRESSRSISFYIYLLVHFGFVKLTILHAWRQRMLKSNIRSCTQHGGRTLHIFMSMAYTRSGRCGEQQDKHGSKSCSLRYNTSTLPYFFSSGSGCVIVCPWLNSGFDLFFLSFLGDNREKTSWWLHTNPFCARSSALH